MFVSLAAISLNEASLEKLMRRDSVWKAVGVLRPTLMILALLLFALGVFAMVNTIMTSARELGDLEQEISKIQAEANQQLSSTFKGETSLEYSQITKRQLFGALGRAKTPPKTPDRPKQTKSADIPLSLIGTFMLGEGFSYAIIENSKKREQEIFNMNEEVFDQGKLIGIYSDHVEIRSNGEVKNLFLDDTPDESGDSGGTYAGDSSEFVLQSSEIDSALENLPLLLTQARAVPYFKEGKSVGMRLFAIKSGSFYEKLGLKNGDILKSINGENLGDFSKAMELFKKLKEERSLNLILERDRKERQYRYTIR